MDESLADKLRSLGVQVGAQNLPAPQKKPSGFPIEKVLEGRTRQTEHGPVFEVVNSFSLDYIHGEVGFNPHLKFQAIAEWARIFPELMQTPLDQFVFLDTETSGLSGGTGTYVFLVGLGYFDHHGFHVLQLFLREPGEEEAFLAGLAQALEGFKIIVSFNGKSFDVPMLATRHILNRMLSPLTGMAHIDLLPLARRLWRNRLASRALKDLETEILRFSRTVEEVPGWMIPELYFEYLRSGDSRPLAGVFYHNTMDIVSLFALFQFCAGFLENPLDNAATPGLDLVAVARLFEDLDKIDLAIEIYAHSLDKGDLPLHIYLDTVRRYAVLYRKLGQWNQAVRLWIAAASRGDLEAMVELAKYHEHQARNYPQARQVILDAIDLLPHKNLPEWEIKMQARELQHRLDRIEKKLKVNLDRE